MSHGFRFYDAQGNLMIDSSSRSFRSVFRAQVFPIENGRYDLPSTYDDSLGDLFFFTGYRDDGWGGSLQNIHGCLVGSILSGVVVVLRVVPHVIGSMW